MVIRNICILGGGTAGWMTAAALSHKFQGLPVDICLVESDQIGTVGVGEATLPHIRAFNNALGIDEADFMRSTEATFKLGIEFCNWGKKGDRYIHPFGAYGQDMDGVPFHHFWMRMKQKGDSTRLDDYSLPIIAAEQNRFDKPSGDQNDIGSSFGYAYQFDSSRYALYLRKYAEARGVRRIEGRVLRTRMNTESGFVEALHLDNEREITAQLFIDCSGFRGVLIEQALETGYDDWSKWLPCNRAIAVPCESHGPLTPYTRATALTGGWQWRIPLQHRMGNGHVYCSEFLSDDEAMSQLMDNLEGRPLAEPRQLYFTTGRRRKFWNKNVVTIGLAGGFMEPLESTSIHLIQEAITELLQLFPVDDFCQEDIDEYNRLIGLQFERVRDFLLLHYVATQRDDSEMWRHFRSMDLPDSLQEKISAWLTRGYIIRYEFGLFLPPSWIAVMMGQNLIPTGYDPRADRIDEASLSKGAASLRHQIHAWIEKSPDHETYLKKNHCWSDTGQLKAAASVQ